MAEVVIDERKVMHQVQMNVKIIHRREVRVRLWLAIQLIRLAGWVSGFDIVFEGMPKIEPPEHFNCRGELIRDE